MSSLFSKPKVPPPPPPPSQDDAARRAAEQAARRQRAGATGRASTILTSGMGVSESAPTASKVLLGQ
jgi:hypothetical protein